MKKFLLFLFSLTFSVGIMAQSTANYTFSTVTNGSLIDMSSGTTQLLGGGQDDAASSVANIGFTFYLMAAPYTQFSVNSNGSLGLGSSVVSTSGTSTGTSTAPRITPFGGDQATITSSGKVHYKLIGSAPNRILVIEWFNMKLNYTGYATATDGDGTYQALLYETSGKIEYIYGEMTVATVFTTGPVVGISAGTSANQTATVTTSTNTKTDGTAWINNVYTVGNIDNLHSTSDGSRRVYSFTPPPAPNPPTNLTFSSIGAFGMTLNWTDASNETGYAVYNSTDGVNYTYLASVAANTVTYAATGLIPGTTYYWKVYSVNEGALSTSLDGTQATSAPGNITTTGSGNWSSTTPDAPWPDGVVPSASDNVTIADGHTVTINTTTATCYNLTVGQGTSGILVYLAGTLSTLTVYSSITVAAGGSFNAGSGSLTTHTLNIGGNTNTSPFTGSLTNNGTFDMYTTAGVTVTFFGTPDATISGTGSTLDFYRVVLNKGAVTATAAVTPPILEIQRGFTVAGANTAGLIYTHTAGVLKIGGSFTLSTPLYNTASYSIPALGGLWLNNANFTAAGQTGSPTNSGLLRVSAGTYNIGTASGNSMGSGTSSVYVIEGGSINVAGRFNLTSTYVNYNQSGGTITVQTVGNTSSSAAGFGITSSTGTIFTMSGGNIIIQLVSTGGTPYDYYVNAATVNITGGTLQFGNASSGTAKIYNILGKAPNVVITNTSANHGLLLRAATTIYGDLTINGTGTFSLGTLYNLDMRGMNATYPGNITNAGTMTLNAGSSQTLTFSSSFGSQTWTNNGTITGNVIPATTINNTFSGKGTVTIPDGLTLTNGTSISASLTLTAGTLTANSLTLGSGGTAGFTFNKGNGSLTNLPTFNYGSGSVTYTYNGTTAQVTGAELPSTITGALTINNAAGVTLNAPLSAGTLTLTSGILTTTPTNLLTITGTTAGSITGYTAAKYVNGPIARRFPSSLATGTTYVFPVGKSAYKPLEFVNALTNSGGTVEVSAEVFDADCGGTPGTNMSALNTNRYWKASIVSGAANFTSTTIRLTEDGLTSDDGIGKSETVDGAYDLVSTTPPSGTTIISDVITSLSYFVIGTKDVPMTYTSSTTTQASTATMLQNSTNQALIGIQIVTTGNSSPLSVTKFTVNANGTTAAATDISNAKIWSTGTSSTFATTEQYGDTYAAPTATDFDITGSKTLVPGTNYFWLTFDIPLNATAFNVVDAECTNVTVSGDHTPTVTAPGGTRTITMNGPTAFTATAVGASQINLTWTKNSVGQDVMVATNSTNSFGTPVNGTPYAASEALPTAGTVIYNGPASGYNHTALSESTTYYYKAWSVDANNYYNTTGVTANAKTECNPISSFPYTEGFESISTANTLPACMAASALGGKCRTYLASATGTNAALYARSGSKFAACYWSPSATQGWFFSAPLQLTEGVTYTANVYYVTDGVAWTDAGLYYGTSATSGAMTNTIVSVSNATATTYTLITGNFTPGSSGVYYIGIRAYNETSAPNYISFDDFSVDLAASCVPPTAGTYSNLQATSVDLSWTSAGSLFNVKYNAVSDFDPDAAGTSVSPDPTTTSCSLSGLSSNTKYYWYVRQDCGGGDVSSWAGPYNFTTSCEVVTTYPYTMGFDGSAPCWTVSTGSIPWALANGSSTDISAPQSGSGFAVKPYSTSTQYLYSAPFDLSSFGSFSAQLNFWIYRHSSTVSADQITFMINTAPSVTGATTLQTYPILTTSPPTVPSSGWYNYTISIPTLWNSAGTTYIVVEGKTTASYSSYDIGLDNFKVEMGTTNWTGASSSDWNTAGNWSNGVPISTGTAIIPDVTTDPILSGSATVNTITIESGGKLEIGSSGSLTVSSTLTNTSNAGLVVKSGGSLIQSSASVAATVERSVSGWGSGSAHGWHFLSSPVASQSVSPAFITDPVENYDFYAWWEPTNQWVNYKNTTEPPTWSTANVLGVTSGSGNFIPGKGYLVAYANADTKTFTGNLNKDNISVSNLSYNTEGANYGWHLLGNPYPSALTWGTAAWSLSGVNATAKIWKESTAAYVDIPANTGIIPPLNGFMVNVSSGTNAITIPTAARTHNSTAWYKASESPGLLLLANDPAGSTAQESVIRFEQTASTGFDPEFDCRFLPGYAPLFYSVQGEEHLSTIALPESGGNVQIPFNFIKNNGTDFSIEAKNIHGIWGPVYLNDLKLGNSQDLTTNPVYAFTSATGDNPARFLVTFSHVGIGENQKDNVFTVYSSGDQLIVVDNSGKNQGDVVVYNMMGQAIASGKLNGNTMLKLSMNVPTGYYLVKITSPQTTQSSKVFIR